MGLNNNLGKLAEVLTVSGSNNYVGVGLTTPGEKLDVIGNIRAKYAANSSNISFEPDFGQVYLVASSADNTFGDKKLVINSSGLSLRTMGTSTAAMEIASDGKVGIGTTSPGQKLTLINGTFQIGGASTFSDNVEIGRVGGDNNMAFATSGTERMRITAGGNVGVNTTTPRSILEVSHTTPSLSISSGLAVESSTDNQVLAGINFYKHYGIANGAAIKILQAGGVGNYGQTHMSFYTTNDNNPYTATASERLRITSAGEVLIGTTNTVAGGILQAASSDSATISVRTTSSGGGQPGINFYHDGNDVFAIKGGSGLRFLSSAANERMRITFEGNVGIGTTSPAQKLHVVGAIRASGDYEQTGNNVFVNTSYDAYLQTDAAGAGIIFRTAGAAEKMRITSGGNVGIGTSSPTHLLTLYGTGQADIKFQNSTATRAYIWSNSSELAFNSLTSNPIKFFVDDSEKIRITASGNLGIGTTSPNEKLSVAGRIEGQNFRRIQITLQTTPQSLGLPINAYSGGGAYLLLISTQYDAGNGTGASLWMIRCGYNGNNFGATEVTYNNTGSGISFSQVNGVLYIAGNTNWTANIQVVSNNLLF
jgi:hypothetical protein